MSEDGRNSAPTTRSPAEFVAQAKEYERNRQYEEALRVWSEQLPDHTDRAAAVSRLHLKYARAAAAEQKWELAADQYRLLFHSGLREEPVRVGLASVVQKAARSAEAGERWAAAARYWACVREIAKDPGDDAKARTNLIRNAIRAAREAEVESKFSQATTLWKMAYEVEPDAAVVWKGIFRTLSHNARFAEEQGQWDEAVAIWSDLRQMAHDQQSQESVRADFTRCAIRAAQSAEEERAIGRATAFWLQAYETGKESAVVRAAVTRSLTTLACAQELAGQRQEAFDTWSRLYEVFPDNERAARAIGRLPIRETAAGSVPRVRADKESKMAGASEAPPDQAFSGVGQPRLVRDYDVVMIVMNGVETDNRVIKTATSVSKFGFEVLLIGYGKTDKAGRTPTLKFDTFDCILLPRITVDTDDVGRRQEMLEQDFFAKIRDLLCDRVPRCLHTHDMNTIGIGSRLQQHLLEKNGKRPVWIHDFHEWVDGLTNIPPDLQALAIREEESYVLGPDYRTTVSPAIAKILKKKYKLRDEPLIILNAPNRSDYVNDRPRTVADDVPVPQGCVLAVYCGQVKETRGVHDFVGGMGAIPNVHLALITNNRGEYIERLLDISSRGGFSDRLHLLPYVPPAEVSSYLRTAAFGVHTMERYGNGQVALPNKLFEYLHAGLPVVVSDCRCMKAFTIQHKVGAVYRFGDSASVAKAVQTVLARLPEFSRNAASVRDEVNWEEQEKVLAEIYAKIANVKQIVYELDRPVNVPSPVLKTKKRKPPTEMPLRILQGVAASANQPFMLASALRARGHLSQSLMIALPKFGYHSDIYLPFTRLTNRQRLRALALLASEFDIFHFHARTFFWTPPQFGFPSFIDLLFLKMLGKHIVFHFRGTEVRLKSQFNKLNPFSYASEDPYGFELKYPEQQQRFMIKIVSGLADLVLVPDAELRSYVPDASLLPRAIDIEAWSPPVRAVGNARPLVIHAPSRDKIKGTGHVLNAVEALRAEGLQFDFQLVQNMSHDEVRAVYEKADIIVDQLLIGWYGVLAVEGMALGKAVVAYIRPDILKHLPNPSPIAVADQNTICDVMRRLITSPVECEKLGRRARRFCVDEHGLTKVAAKAESYYRSLSQSAPARVDEDKLNATVECLYSTLAAHDVAQTEVRRMILQLKQREGVAAKQARLLAQALPIAKKMIRDKAANEVARDQAALIAKLYKMNLSSLPAPANIQKNGGRSHNGNSAGGVETAMNEPAAAK